MLDNIVFGITRLARTTIQAISDTIEISENIAGYISDVLTNNENIITDSKEDYAFDSSNNDEGWVIIGLVPKHKENPSSDL